MTTSWNPEEEDILTEQPQTSDVSPVPVIDGPTWDNLSIQERVSRAVSLGVSGRLGSRSWDNLNLEEQAVLSGKMPGVKLEYQVKAHIALEDSDTEPWGIAKDTSNDFSWKAGEGSIVGTWSRSPIDGLIHVFLESTVAALHDKATQNFYDFAEKRKLEVPTSGSKKKRAPRTPKVQAEPERDEAQEEIDKLRNLFKK